MDEKFLAAAPRLRAVFYGAGSVKSVVSDAFWTRGIRITSAARCNAIPVAEYTVANVILSLKHFWRYAMGMQRERRFIPEQNELGAFQVTIGLISLGAIGRLVAQRLRGYDVRVIASDPFCPAGEAQALGVELVPLDEVFRASDVVSLHTPWLPETEGLITGRHFCLMRQNATFINTARGIVVREEEMLDVLQARPDLTAILDVIWPDPPATGSRLFTLPNVILTPHLAGAVGRECRRLGYYMVEELDRYLAGDPLQGEVTREGLARLA